MAILLFCILIGIGAEAAAADLFQIKLQAGASLSQPQTSGFMGSAPSKYRLGLTAGPGVDISLRGRYGIGFETLYTQRGYRLADDTDVGMNYLFVPLYAWYEVSFLRALAGGYYARQLGDITIQIPGSSAGPTNWTTVSNWGSSNFDSWDWGILFGLSASLSQKFFVSGRYAWGMKNLLISPAGASFKNAALDILVGINL